MLSIDRRHQGWEVTLTFLALVRVRVQRRAVLPLMTVMIFTSAWPDDINATLNGSAPVLAPTQWHEFEDGDLGHSVADQRMVRARLPGMTFCFDVILISQRRPGRWPNGFIFVAIYIESSPLHPTFPAHIHAQTHRDVLSVV